MTQLKDIWFQGEVITQWELNTALSPVNSHISNTSNPHSVTKAQVWLSDVDNTSDLNKPISTATQNALDLKVDKVSGKQLSQEDYTTTEKNKLSGIEAGAEVNNISDVNATDLTDGWDTTLHTHDSRYYTESETDALLSTKANDTTVVKLTWNQSILGRKHFYNNDTFLWDGAKSYLWLWNQGTNQEVYIDARSDVYADVDIYIRAKWSNWDINFVTNSLNRLFIKSDGNIGIWETNPTAKLHVKSLASNSTVQIWTSSDGGSIAEIAEFGDTRWAFVVKDASSNTKVMLDSGWNSYFTGWSLWVGMTTPAFSSGSGIGIFNSTAPRLKLFNTISWSTASDWFDITLFGSDAYLINRENGTMRFLTGNLDRMIIDTSGNVGINELVPDYKLDVNGSFGFTPWIGTTVTPVDNWDIVFESTSNTSLVIKMKWSDGVVRSTTLTLA